MKIFLCVYVVCIYVCILRVHKWRYVRLCYGVICHKLCCGMDEGISVCIRGIYMCMYIYVCILRIHKRRYVHLYYNIIELCSFVCGCQCKYTLYTYFDYLCIYANTCMIGRCLGASVGSGRDIGGGVDIF